mgnify:FL=1
MGGQHMADRGDEMVIAGMRPYSPNDANNPYLRLHRGVSFVLFVDSLILLYITSIIASGWFGNSAGIVTGIVATFLIVVWLAYRARNPKAYWVGCAVIGIAGLFFGFNALYSLVGVITGDAVFLLWVFLFSWAMFGSFRRSMSHFHPVYKNTYFGREQGLPSLEMAAGEMLAACPHCMAVLAIQPNLLSHEDKCPYCNLHLVSKELASMYEQE